MNEVRPDNGQECRPRPWRAKVVAIGVAPMMLLSSLALGGDGSVPDLVLRDSVPPRATDTSSVLLSDDELWSQIESSRGMAVVGLKARDRNRGVWRDQVLLDAEGTERASKEVLDRPGVSLLTGPKGLPTMSVKIGSAGALAQLRRLADVDYVEPLYVQLEMQSAGCKQADYKLENMDAENKQDWYRQTASPTTWRGDWVPWNYSDTKIRDAWVRANGDDVTIGVIDTGVFPEQPQLRDGEFQSGDSWGRSVMKFGPDRWWEWGNNPTPDDQCGHGTRMAGTVAAPFDGRNMVGVAWKADLVIERAGDDVILGWNNQWDVANAIDRIAWLNRPRTVIAMAFGRYGELATVADAIRRHPRIVFVAAAGSRSGSSSLGCIPGWSYFPATMPEVIGTSGTEPGTTSVSRQACAGPETDIAPVIGDVPATGRDPGQQWLWGGSSDATGVTAGIAALIWQAYPWFSSQDVRSRLLSTADGTTDPNLGRGNPNAYRAVGGYAGLHISGPSEVSPGQTYTLTAQPKGDGPFTYRWSTGETTRSITRTAGTSASGSQTWSVTVTDTRENKSRFSSKTVSWSAPAPPPIEDPPCSGCSVQ